MAAVTAALVKELREATGAGMMDCKKALTATDGDMDKAVEFLREKGLAGAQKKAGRIAAEGIVDTKIADDGKNAVIVEVNAETDFVAKNEKFRDYVKEVALQALSTAAAGIDAFMEEPWANDASLTVAQKLSSMIAIIGENMHIRRFEKLDAADGFVESYIHAGGKIGVLLDVESDVVNDELKEMAKNVCMQVAALNPSYLNKESVPESVLASEKDIMLVQMKNDPKNANKPEAVLTKIIDGKMGKYYEQNCLTEQSFFMDETVTIGKYIANTAKELGGDIQITDMIRFEKGEGIEKRVDNFAEEVASMVK